MYAVIKTGGKQYKVSQNDVIKVEKLPGEVGNTVEIPSVLAVGYGESLRVGSPTVEGASVVAEILVQDRDKKIIIFKKKKRKGYAKRQGHRQSFTSIRIQEIKA
ncbi:MAG: 50S ribosomal protein L21 [Deltaproteobacteria bacterium]|nr:50S ribosomal protein L21 [Deltaproteobacteria bacterium]